MAKSRRSRVRHSAPVARRSNKFGYRIEHWIIFGVSCLVAGFLISTFIQGSGAKGKPGSQPTSIPIVTVPLTTGNPTPSVTPSITFPPPTCGVNGLPCQQGPNQH